MAAQKTKIGDGIEQVVPGNEVSIEERLHE